MPGLLLHNIPDSYETRAFAEDLRIDAEIGTFEGHASAFNYVDDHATAFLKGAFRKTLTDKGDRLPVLWMHERGMVVGPVLDTKEDKQGVYHRSKAIDDGQTGTMVLAHLRGGNHMGMSFGFRTRKDRAATEMDGIDLSTAPEGTTLKDVRAITEVELFEYSVLPWTFASQPKAGIANVRESADDAIDPETLSSLLDAIKAGRVDETRTSLIEQIVAAWGARAEPEAVIIDPLPLTPDKARRDRDIAIVVALARAKGYVECVA